MQYVGGQYSKLSCTVVYISHFFSLLVLVQPGKHCTTACLFLVSAYGRPLDMIKMEDTRGVHVLFCFANSTRPFTFTWAATPQSRQHLVGSPQAALCQLFRPRAPRYGFAPEKRPFYWQTDVYSTECRQRSKFDLFYVRDLNRGKKDQFQVWCINFALNWGC